MIWVSYNQHSVSYESLYIHWNINFHQYCTEKEGTFLDKEWMVLFLCYFFPTDRALFFPFDHFLHTCWTKNMSTHCRAQCTRSFSNGACRIQTHQARYDWLFPWWWAGRGLWSSDLCYPMVVLLCHNLHSIYLVYSVLLGRSSALQFRLHFMYILHYFWSSGGLPAVVWELRRSWPATMTWKWCATLFTSHRYLPL